MAIAEIFAGTESVSTEHSMTTDTAGPDAETSDAIVQALVDTNAMVTNSALTIRVYEKVLASSTQRLASLHSLFGAQIYPIWISPMFMLMHGWDLTLKEGSGAITYTWSIRSVGTPTEAFSGTEAVGATEWSLTTDTAGPDAETSDGVFQLWLDLNDMVVGDLLRVRFYEKVQSTDTQRILYEAYLSGPCSPPVVAFPAITFMHGWDITLETLAGTSITVDWSIRKAA